MNIVFQIHKLRNAMGGLLILLLQRPMILIAISYIDRGRKGARAKPPGNFRLTPFPSEGNAILDVERALLFVC